MSRKPTYQELEKRIHELEQAQREHDQAASDLTHFKQVLDSFPFGIYIVNDRYQIEYVNAYIQKEFGNFKNSKCHEHFHALDAPCPWCRNKLVF